MLIMYDIVWPWDFRPWNYSQWPWHFDIEGRSDELCWFFFFCLLEVNSMFQASNKIMQQSLRISEHFLVAYGLHVVISGYLATKKKNVFRYTCIYFFNFYLPILIRYFQKLIRITYNSSCRWQRTNQTILFLWWQYFLHWFI